MRRKLVVVALGALMVGAVGVSPAAGEAPQGSERGMITAAFLRESCADAGAKPVDVKRAVCGGYLRGYLEGMRAQSITIQAPEPCCAAPETPITAFAESFNRWYDAHKPPANELAAASFGKALVENYPCAAAAP